MILKVLTEVTKVSNPRIPLLDNFFQSDFTLLPRLPA